MDEASMPAQVRRVLTILGIVVGTLAIFVLDAATPVGYLVAFLYFLVILAAALTEKPWAVVATTAAAIILTVIAPLMKFVSVRQLPIEPGPFNRVGVTVVLLIAGIGAAGAMSRAAQVRVLGERLETVALEGASSRQIVEAARQLTLIGAWSYSYVDNPDEAVFWSDEVALIHGYPPGTQPTAAESLSGYSEEDTHRLSEAIARSGATGEPFMEEFRITTLLGDSRVVQVMGDTVRDVSGSVIRINGVVQDVTVWKDVESAVATQRRRFSQLASSMPIIIWTANEDGTVDYFNEAMQRFSGKPLEALVGIGWAELVHPDDIESVWEAWARALLSRETYDHEFRLRNVEGDYLWHHVSAQLEFGEAGQVVRWWGNAIDIDSVFRLRDNARVLVEERERLLESTGDGVYTVDYDWKFVYVNSMAEKLVSRSANDLIGKVLWEEFPILVGTDADRHYHRAMAERHSERFVHFNPRLDKWFDISAVPSSAGLTVFLRDITEARVLAEQLAQAQRLESVGRLTGGIAHDFNNLLTVVVGAAEAIEADPEVSEESSEMAGLVLQAAHRGAELTQRLLTFARRQPLEPKSADIPAQLAAVTPLLKRTLGEGITVVTSASPNLPLVTVDPGQLENALINLAINARDAMDGVGTLTLEVGTQELTDTYATIHGDVESGNYVVISVTDTGTGIDPTHLPRLFDPFFTTKGVGEGSGLGLPMVWGFAKQSGGHVTVYSELGHGTTFRLYLPLASDFSASERVEGANSPVPERGVGHILLAEDDPLVQQFAAEHLRAHGYTVTVAESGPQALDLLGSIGHVDLLFTDVIMPGGMTGRQLADAVLERLPGTPVLFSSGYTENVVLHNGALDEGVSLLAKPYSGRTLLRKVHESISQAGGRTS
jgi:PAS domain S-box-containing protein